MGPNNPYQGTSKGSPPFFVPSKEIGLVDHLIENNAKMEICVGIERILQLGE